MMLRDYKVEADPRDNNGQSPIFYAASANQVETIKVLVKYGADVKAQDTLLAQTALYYAAR
jgi:ankyrin repeat protein